MRCRAAWFKVCSCFVSGVSFRFSCLEVRHPALRVPPGGNQVDGLPPASIQKFRADFLKNLSFYTISIHFLDFLRLFIDIAEAYARGFAPL